MLEIIFVLFLFFVFLIMFGKMAQSENRRDTRRVAPKDKYSHRAPGDQGLFGPMYTEKQRQAKARYWKNFPRKAMGGSPHIRGYPDKKKRL